jgi:hypothetical protein
VICTCMATRMVTPKMHACMPSCSCTVDLGAGHHASRVSSLLTCMRVVAVVLRTVRRKSCILCELLVITNSSFNSCQGARTHTNTNTHTYIFNGTSILYHHVVCASSRYGIRRFCQKRQEWSYSSAHHSREDLIDHML